jgi:hypothetical protein
VLGGGLGEGVGLEHQVVVEVGEQTVEPRRQAVGAERGHHLPLLDHEDPVLLHPGLQGAVREGAMSQAEHEGVTGHGRPEVPVGLDEAVGERHHSLILPAPQGLGVLSVCLVGEVGPGGLELVWSRHERPGSCGSHSLMTTVEARACRPIILDPVRPDRTGPR